MSKYLKGKRKFKDPIDIYINHVDLIYPNRCWVLPVHVKASSSEAAEKHTNILTLYGMEEYYKKPANYHEVDPTGWDSKVNCTAEFQSEIWQKLVAWYRTQYQRSMLYSPDCYPIMAISICPVLFLVDGCCFIDSGYYDELYHNEYVMERVIDAYFQGKQTTVLGTVAYEKSNYNHIRIENEQAFTMMQDWSNEPEIKGLERHEYNTVYLQWYTRNHMYHHDPNTDEEETT